MARATYYSEKPIETPALKYHDMLITHDPLSPDGVLAAEAVFRTLVVDIKVKAPLERLGREIEHAFHLTRDQKQNLKDLLVEQSHLANNFIIDVILDRKFTPVAGGKAIELRTAYDYGQAILNYRRIFTNIENAMRLQLGDPSQCRICRHVQTQTRAKCRSMAPEDCEDPCVVESSFPFVRKCSLPDQR